MEKITIAGKEYSLLFNMYSMEKIEEKYGQTREIITRLAESPKQEIKLVRELFVIMVNTAKNEAGEEEDADDTPLKKMKFQDYAQLQLRQREIIEIARGMKSETTGGNEADDEKHDEWLEEDSKNAATGAG